MKLFSQEFGQGFPLVILHGLLGSLDNWHSLGRRFAEHFRVFTPDQRNHGRSPHSHEFNYRVMAQDLLEFLKSVRVSETFLIGHSMGGKTAMTFALTNPSMVRKLVVVDISPRAYPARHDEILEALSDLDLKQFKTRKQVDEALSQRISSSAVRQFLMKNLKRDDSNAFDWKMNLEVIRRHHDEMNSAITSDRPFHGKTLFVRSSRSDYVRDNDLPLIRSLFPDVKVADVDVGHWIHAEAPDRFYKIVLDFLFEPS